MRYVLDTHVWLWASLAPQLLSRRVRGILANPARHEELLLSAISPWELCKLLEKGRVTVSDAPERWMDAAMARLGLRLLPLTPGIAHRSTVLPPPFHDDPADQIIVATAREEGATILTKDESIRSYPHVRSLW